MSYINSLPLCENVAWLRGIIIVFGALIALWSVLLVGRVLELNKHNQIPLPQTPVFFKARVYRDWRVTLDIAGCIVTIVLFCGGYVWLVVEGPAKVLFHASAECVSAKQDVQSL